MRAISWEIQIRIYFWNGSFKTRIYTDQKSSTTNASSLQLKKTVPYTFGLGIRNSDQSACMYCVFSYKKSDPYLRGIGMNRHIMAIHTPVDHFDYRRIEPSTSFWNNNGLTCCTSRTSGGVSSWNENGFPVMISYNKMYRLATSWMRVWGTLGKCAAMS